MRRERGVNHPRSGGGGTSHNGLYGEAPSERGTSFRPQVYERVRISLNWSIQRGGEIRLSVCKKTLRANRRIYGCKKVEKISWFFLFIHKDSEFAAVKRDATFYTKYVERVPFVNRRYTKGIPFVSKMEHKRVRDWTSRQRPGIKNLLSTPFEGGARGEIKCKCKILYLRIDSSTALIMEDKELCCSSASAVLFLIFCKIGKYTWKSQKSLQAHQPRASIDYSTAS